MDEGIVIVGASTRPSTLADLAVKGFQVRGFVDLPSNAQEATSTAGDHRNDAVPADPPLGDVEWLAANPSPFVFGGGSPDQRREVARVLEDSGCKPVRLVHAGAEVSSSTDLGDGVVIGPRCTISTDVRVGPHTQLGTGCTVQTNTTIGAFTQVGDHVVIENNCRIGDDTVVASGSVITAGSELGPGSLVPAGAVVYPEGEFSQPSSLPAPWNLPRGSDVDRHLPTPPSSWVEACARVGLVAMVAALIADTASRVLSSASATAAVGGIATAVSALAYSCGVGLGIMRRARAEDRTGTIWYQLGIVILLTLSSALRIEYREQDMPTPARAALPVAAALVVAGLQWWSRQRDRNRAP